LALRFPWASLARYFLLVICQPQTDSPRSIPPMRCESSTNRGCTDQESFAQVVQILVTGYGPLGRSEQEHQHTDGRQRAIGSGFVIDPSGYIVTNAPRGEGCAAGPGLVLRPRMPMVR